jgi:hypothetical protein
MAVSKLGLLTFGLILLFLIALMVVMLTTDNNDIAYLGLLVPLGLFAFVIYKFGKEGLVTILYLIGIFFIYGGITYRDLEGKLIILAIGVILFLAGYFLGKKWNVGIYKPKQG